MMQVPYVQVEKISPFEVRGYEKYPESLAPMDPSDLDAFGR